MGRIRVTAAELREKWMSWDGIGMTEDHQTQTRVVQMADGTEYETTFEEIRAARAGGDAQ